MIEYVRLEDGDDVFDLTEEIDVDELDLGFPEVRVVKQDRPGRHGSFDYTQFFGSRVVSLTGTAWPSGGRSAAQVVDDVRRFLRPGRRPSLVWKYEGEAARQTAVRIAAHAAPLSASLYAARAVQFQWEAPDGRQHSADELEAIANPDQGEAGRFYDLGFDRTYPASTGLGRVTCLNDGNVDADPVIRVFGPCEDPRLEHVESGLRLEFGGLNLAPGDYLELDAANRTVRLNGDESQNYYGFLDVSEWFVLEPGENTIRFYPVTSSGASQAQVFWRHAWL